MSFTERIRVGQRDIAEDEVRELVASIRSDVTSRGIDLTFFEFTTVIAFVHFASAGVDAAVIEVGLGGRLDATNVVDPVVAVITTIGFDHQAYLGNTLREIAAEKGGIIKPTCPTVVGRLPPEASEVLATIARERGSRIYALGNDFSMQDLPSPTYTGLRQSWHRLEIGLRGAHQRDNAACALAAIELLAPALIVPEQAVRTGLAEVHWPGRLEVLDTQPLIILDGAHNEDGVVALLKEVKPLFRGRRVRLLFGVMSDKLWLPMVHALAAVADEVTVTSVLPPRGESPDRLASVFGQMKPTTIVGDPGEAFQHLRNQAHATDAILVAGSLFLIGAIHSHLRRHPPDRKSTVDTAAP